MDRRLLKGVLFSLTIALAAAYLGREFPIVGGPVFGIILGIAIGNLPMINPYIRHDANTGITFCSKKILQWAIIVLGLSLNLKAIAVTGKESLIVMVSTLLAALIASIVFGRLGRIPGRLTSLIGVGTAICGGSAIAAVAPIISAEATEISYSISTVFFFNILAVLIFPPLGHLLNLSSKAFGLWAGTAINDTSSVVAAGYAFSHAAGTYATIVKLARTTVIIPVSFTFAVVMAGRGTDKNIWAQVKRVFPWFIVWFLVAATINSLGLLPSSIGAAAGNAGKFMIIIALSAIGLGTDIKKLTSSGVKPLLFGLSVWASVAVVSLIVQHLTGQI